MRCETCGKNHNPITRICMHCATPHQLTQVSSYDPTEDGKVLRVSKSSFMGYLYCPRQYWWERVELKDMRFPPTEAMLRGTEVHDAVENLYEAWEGTSSVRHLLPEGQVYDTIAQLEEARMGHWGITSWEPIEVEQKRVYWSEEYNCVFVGKIDGVFLTPEGTICIFELKTGSFNDRKVAKTRKELCFYRQMLIDMGETRPITHFAYMGPDAVNEKFLDRLRKQKGKTVICGEDSGILLIEKVNQRSINTFEKDFLDFRLQIGEEKWPMKWSDYVCPQWCNFSMACESELTGVDFEWE